MIAAIAVVRDEADIIATTVAQMQGQVDEVIVADNGSTDGTLEILCDLGITVLHDSQRGFYQAAKVTWLAEVAFGMGADWVVPFDADEFWQAPPGETVACVLNRQPEQVRAVGAVFWNHVPTDVDDESVTDPVRRMEHRELGNGQMLRVCARTAPGLVIEDGNHFVSYDGGDLEFAWPALAVRHFSLRSFDQFKAKARKCVDGLAAADLHPAIASHWREWAPIVDDEAALRAVWESRVRRADEFSLVRDPVFGG